MANIPRIDNFIIKTTRNYYASLPSVDNSLIFPIVYLDPNFIEKTRFSGHIPPEAFIYLDQENYIQDKNKIPTIYHMPRSKLNKKIMYEPDIICILNKNRLRYSLDIPIRDYKDNYMKTTDKY